MLLVVMLSLLQGLTARSCPLFPESKTRTGMGKGFLLEKVLQLIRARQGRLQASPQLFFTAAEEMCVGPRYSLIRVVSI